MSTLSKIKSALRRVKHYYIKKNRYKNVIKNLGDDITNSNYFKNNDINKCFNNKIIDTNNDAIIERIIQAYKKAKKTQKGLPEVFQVSNEWLPIFSSDMGKIMNALDTGDKLLVKNIYENFMRESCSMGLHGLPGDMNNTYFVGKISKLDSDIYLHDTIYRYKHWQSLTENKYSEKDLEMSDYGNTYGYYINDKFIRTGAEYLHYYATRISELIEKEKDRKIVVELGGGYGGLGYFLNKLLTNTTYIDLDLPENMALTAYYLMNSFPEKKVLLYGEDVLNEITISKYDIILMPNFEIVNLPSEKVNIVFNSYSLAEMSTETIKTYVTELKRVSKEYIYHVNHTVISNSLKADEFGIEDDSYKLIFKKPALWNMGRNSSMDEFEFLYSKKTI